MSIRELIGNGEARAARQGRLADEQPGSETTPHDLGVGGGDQPPPDTPTPVIGVDQPAALGLLVADQIEDPDQYTGAIGEEVVGVIRSSITAT